MPPFPTIEPPTGEGDVSIAGSSIGDGEIEVSLDAVKRPRSKAQKRWALLRNVRMAVRKNSLTKPEEDLLKAIGIAKQRRRESIACVMSNDLGVIDEDVDEEGMGGGRGASRRVTMPSNLLASHAAAISFRSLKIDDSIEEEDIDEDNESKAKTKVRRSIRMSICEKTSLLTDTEREFLEDLVDAPDVSLEALNTTWSVLNGDMLYQMAEEDSEEGVEAAHYDTCLAQNDVRPNESEFRMALWNATKKSTASKVKEEKKKEETSPTSDDTNEDSQSSLGDSFFHGSLSDSFNAGFGFLTGEKIVDKDKVEDVRNDESESKEKKSQSHEVDFEILGTTEEDVPNYVLSPPLMSALRQHMPYAYQADNFWLKYSMASDGASMHSLLKKIRSSVRTVLAIETTDGEVFGAFTSSPWRSNGNHYYGSCEAFLWRMKESRNARSESVTGQIKLERDVDHFKWSGENRNIQLSNPQKLFIGGGEPEVNKAIIGQAVQEYGFGLALNSDFSSGTSNFCVTFGSPGLCKSGELFQVTNLDVWTMTPVDSLAQAEQLEIARQFVFDHGNIRFSQASAHPVGGRAKIMSARGA